MEEQEIDGEVLFADLHRVLGTDEAEIATELGDESAEVTKECTVEVGLGMAVGKAEELERIGVLEVLHGGGVDLCQRR